MGNSASLAVPELRVDGADKVRGEARYAADVTRPGMLQAAFVRSPHPHALIRSVDVSAARALPGVRAVLTGADVRPARFGRHTQDWPVLAWERVRFVGDRVAAIAADTREAAEAAARAVQVAYDPLPAVFDPDEALKPDAPVLHPDQSSYTRLSGTPHPTLAHPNLQARMAHEHGDVDAGFAKAVRIFDRTFDLARVHNGYLEPRACVVWIEGTAVHVITTNKAPFRLREQMAATLGLEPGRIEVESVTIGGDFGAKGLSLDEHACYFLAKATGLPVRSVLRYADEMQGSTTRRAARVRLRTGIDAEGRFTAHEARIVFDGGAYAAGSPGAGILPRESLLTLAGYAVPAARLEAIGVYTNQLPGGSVRGPGQPQVAFAAESQVDEIARALGVDPLDYRDRILAQHGEMTVRGEVWHGSEMPQVIAAVRAQSGWGSPLPAGHGRGVALGFRHQGSGKATVELTLSADGTVEVLTGMTEQGTGVTTVMARLVALELGIDIGRVRVVRGTTAEAGDDPGAGGSKSTIVHGGAAQHGARTLAAILAERAPGLGFDDAARKVAPVKVTGAGSQEKHAYGACAQVIEVAVDNETGAFRIVRADVVADVGGAINPVGLRGQLEGGFVFGLGQAVMEDAAVTDGRLVCPNLGEYKLPAVGDVPPVRITQYTDDPGFGPYGAKSVGELINPGVAPAVANAIADATGTRPTALPLVATRLYEGLRGT